VIFFVCQCKNYQNVQEGGCMDRETLREVLEEFARALKRGESPTKAIDDLLCAYDDELQ